jgi:protein involved in polysaccharide export with SLBB domain
MSSLKRIYNTIGLVIMIPMALHAQGGGIQAIASSENEGATSLSPSFSEALSTPEGRVALAMVTPEYLVTPGDVYTLTFLTASGPVVSSLIVEFDYALNLSTLGLMNTAGMRFTELRENVRKRVMAAYPLSSPQLIIQSIGMFKVLVKGEVKQASFIDAFSLMRLSDVWKGVTENASYRDIKVTSKDGSSAVYDLFHFWRDGNLKENPYLRPGDVIEIGKAVRRVTISGEVLRPGEYQLKPEDQLRDLVETYGGGLKDNANPSRMRLYRSVPGSSGQGEGRIIDYRTNGVSLQNLDIINVPSIQELLPVAFFEGAIGAAIDGEDPQISRRIEYTFRPGESISTATQNLRKSFTAVSDLAKAYVFRQGAKIPIDLQRFLYGKDFLGDMVLEPGDVIIVPFRQFFVTVSGAVKVPGRYPYVPDRYWKYYVGLAGGFDDDKNSGEAIQIMSASGDLKTKSDVIQPEDSIIAQANDPLYRFQKVASVIASIISVASLVLGLVQIFSGNGR